MIKDEVPERQISKADIQNQRKFDQVEPLDIEDKDIRRTQPTKLNRAYRDSQRLKRQPPSLHGSAVGPLHVCCVI